MQRSPRSTRGLSTQNFDDFDEKLMKRAREITFIFVKKGDLSPIVIAYNSVMWPTDMTTRQKVNLANKKEKTKLYLNYEGKPILCSLSCVVENKLISDAQKQVGEKMVAAEGQLSDISFHSTQQVSPSPLRSSLKRKVVCNAENAGTKAKKSIKFSKKDADPEVSLYQEETICQETAINDPSADNLFDLSGLKEGFSNSIQIKFKKLIEVHEEHARKLCKQNSSFRNRLVELLRRDKSVEVLKPSVVVSGEPIKFGDLDLMTLNPIGGPSSFGRLLAATLFGAEEKCELMNKRLGAKIMRSNCRERASLEKEQLFKDCIARFYPDDVNKAISLAIRGGNQYGVDMKNKYQKYDENIPPNDDADD